MTNGIAYVDFTTGVSGTETIVLGLATRAAARGELAGVVLPQVEAVDRLAKDAAQLGRVERIRPVTSRRDFGANALATRQALERLNPSLVHFHCPSYRWGLDSVIGSGLRGRYAVIRTEHNPLMAQPKFAFRKLIGLADRTVDRFTYVSEGNRDRFEQYLPARRGRGTVVANGVDLTRFEKERGDSHRCGVRRALGLSAQSRIAIYVGTFGGRRSLRTMLEGLALAIRQSPATTANWQLLVVGEGDTTELELPGQYGIQDLVNFVGRRNDVPELLMASDLFVTSSDFEGMSLSMLEAWAAGLPVLSTPVDGVSDIVGSNAVPLITAQHGDAEDFARQWLRYMRGETELLAIHRVASRIVLEQHSAEAMFERYEDAYAETFEARASTRAVACRRTIGP